jgi:hypothetical protein
MFFEVARFGDFGFRTVDFPLDVLDRREHRISAAVQGPEKETEVHVNENDEAHGAQQQLLDLILG